MCVNFSLIEYMLREKYCTIDEKTTQKLSWAKVLS